MKILKILWVCCLVLCILLPINALGASNISSSDLQTQKKITILKQLEKADLITTEIKMLDTDDRESVQCLALNIYHEARGSTLEDRVASSYVVFNRLNDKAYPLTSNKTSKTICDVIFDRYQFCWTNNKKIPFPKELGAWNDAQKLAYELYTNPVHKELAKQFGLKHYVVSNLLTDTHRPKWIDKRTTTVKIGAHSYMSLVSEKSSKNDLKMIITKSSNNLK